MEEFHSKLQQIGADKTKGIMITHTGAFQKSALSYAQSKGITLARLLPDNQVKYVMHCITDVSLANFINRRNDVKTIVSALIKREFCSSCGERFFSLTGARNLESLITNLLQ